MKTATERAREVETFVRFSPYSDLVLEVPDAPVEKWGTIAWARYVLALTSALEDAERENAKLQEEFDAMDSGRAFEWERAEDAERARKAERVGRKKAERERAEAALRSARLLNVLRGEETMRREAEKRAEAAERDNERLREALRDAR